MPQADIRPAGLDVLARTGSPVALALTFPADYLDGKTFTASVGGTSISPVVAGDVMTLALTGAQTGALGNGRHAILLTDTTGDDVVRISGRLLLGSTATDSPDQTVTILTDTPVSVTVTVASGGVDLATVQDLIDDLIAGAPGALDTLNELAAALGDDANFATTVTNALAAKASQAELDAEATTRAAADTALGVLITDEATARASGDSALDARLDVIEALGPLATDAEVAAAIAALSGTYQPLSAQLTTVAGRTDAQEATALRSAGLDTAYASLSAKQRDRAALKQFRYKLAAAKAGTGTCDILAIGDSKTEGNNATARTKRWQDVLAGLLRTYWQPAGITGGGPYLPGKYTSGIGFTDPAATTGGATTNINVGGLGRHAIALVNGSTATFTVGPGVDRVDLFYLKYPGGPSTMTVAVDGGTAVAVPTSAASQTDGWVYAITGLATGSTHTIVVTGPTSGTTYIHGIYAYQGDKTQGIRLWDSGQGGSTTSSWGNGLPTSGALFNMAGSITTIQPSLVIIDLMTNDFSAAAPAIAPATSQTNLAAIVSFVRSKCTVAPSIVICIPFQRTGSFTYQWADYVAAAEAVANADGSIALWYGGKALFDAGSMPSGFSSDSIHPSDLGHQMWAEDLYRYLTAPLGTSQY